MPKKLQTKSVKLPRTVYELAKQLAHERGCFIGRVIADALLEYRERQAKEQAA